MPRLAGIKVVAMEGLNAMVYTCFASMCSHPSVTLEIRWAVRECRGDRAGEHCLQQSAEVRPVAPYSV